MRQAGPAQEYFTPYVVGTLTVPTQCPLSARYSARTVPTGKTQYNGKASRKEKE